MTRHVSRGVRGMGPGRERWRKPGLGRRGPGRGSRVGVGDRGLGNGASGKEVQGGVQGHNRGLGSED